MILYRVGNWEEKDIILREESCLEIGRYFQDHKMNTFHYENTRYMHLFGKQDDLIIFGVHSNDYIFTYRIPDEVVDNYKGIGYYYQPDNFSYFYSVDEYAIPSSEIDFNYLDRIEHVSDEFFYGNTYEDLVPFLEEVYSKEKPKVLVRSDF